MSMSHKRVATLLLAVVAYGVASCFEDLPPRGIYLDASVATLGLRTEEATVEVALTYQNRSWWSRRTSVYLPVTQGEGEGDPKMETMLLPSDWHASAYDDGVVMRMALASDARETAVFRFRQALTQKRFRYGFGIPRGWVTAPQRVEVRVEAPAVWRMQFSSKPVDVKSTNGRAQYTFRVDDNAELEMTWE